MLLEKLGTPRTSEEPMSLPNSKIIFARETWLNKIAQNWDGQDILIYGGKKKTPFITALVQKILLTGMTTFSFYGK